MTMSPMALTLLAPGSPDPRHARDVSALAGRLKVSGTAAQVAHLDRQDPSPAEAARTLHRAGAGWTTVVPLAVSPTHQQRVALPAAIRAMREAVPSLDISVADPIGCHPLLLDSVAELLSNAQLPLDDRTGIILAAGGSRDPRSMSALESLFGGQGSALAQALGVRAARTAYLDGGRPIGRIRALMRCVDGCRTFVVVPLVLTDGIQRDRIVTAARRYDAPIAPGALADTRALAQLVVLRAEQAHRAPLTAAAVRR